MQLNLFADYAHIFSYLEKITPMDLPLYLVGGAIRDALLQQPTHDLDFVLGGDIRSAARRMADRFEGAYFLLDDERNTARVLLPGSNGERLVLDFVAMQGRDIHEDLRRRDFTINAVAYDLREKSAVDPLKGALDLKNRLLVPCSADACQQDPVRILRGVRLALNYELKITQSAKTAMEKAVPLLKRVSSERIRDEVFRILDLRRTAAAMRILDKSGTLKFIFPELITLQAKESSTERQISLWELALSVLDRLEILFGLVIGHREEDRGENMMAGMVVLQLGPYRFRLQEHMAVRLNPHRTRTSLLKLAGLYAAAGSPDKDLDELTYRARQMALSKVETQYLDSTLRAMYMLTDIENEKPGLPPKSIYRFFHQFGEVGLDGCLLYLAHYWAARGVYLDPKDWGRRLESIFKIFEAWWDKKDEIVNPPVLLNGNDLMKDFNLYASPLVGELLQEIRERQAAGEITDREDALEYTRKRLLEEN